MAVSIDRVYQKVLALANKEQRGYITPQEFNLFADHAQMEIFEQYFYDLNQFKRAPGSEIKLADLGDMILEKLNGFISSGVSSVHNFDSVTALPDFYRIESIYLSNPNGLVSGVISVEQTTVESVVEAQSSPLTRPTSERPLYRFGENSTLFFYPYPNPIGDYKLYYTKKPKTPNWGYVISGENALFNPNSSIDFELHSSEENKLVIKILALAGVAIKDVQLAQVAAGKEASITQQQKQ
jgi:hypothetical protein